MSRVSKLAVLSKTGGGEFETCCFFNTKIKGNHHLQGNLEVYNVRIPVFDNPPILTTPQESSISKGPKLYFKFFTREVLRTPGVPGL